MNGSKTGTRVENHEHPFGLKILHAATLGFAIAAFVIALVGYCQCGDCCKDGTCCTEETIEDETIYSLDEVLDAESDADILDDGV